MEGTLSSPDPVAFLEGRVCAGTKAMERPASVGGVDTHLEGPLRLPFQQVVTRQGWINEQGQPWASRHLGEKARQAPVSPQSRMSSWKRVAPGCVFRVSLEAC